MSRTDPAMDLARHLAHESQDLTALILHAAAHTTREAYTRQFDLDPDIPEGGAVTSYHRTTAAEADMVCLDCNQPFGPFYASVITGTTGLGREITELICSDCARLGRP